LTSTETTKILVKNNSIYNSTEEIEIKTSGSKLNSTNNTSVLKTSSINKEKSTSLKITIDETENSYEINSTLKKNKTSDLKLMLLPEINNSLSVSQKDIINDKNSRTEKTLILEIKKNEITEEMENSSVLVTKVDVSNKRLN